jgi:hypothetical protein
MIKRESFKVKPEDANILWDVELPTGATKARPLAAYGPNGDSYEIDSWSFINGHLIVNFGIDPVSGELEYEYQVTGEDQIVVDTSGNTVSITINQYGGGSQSTPSFPEGS